MQSNLDATSVFVRPSPCLPKGKFTDNSTLSANFCTLLFGAPESQTASLLRSENASGRPGDSFIGEIAIVIVPARIASYGVASSEAKYSSSL